MACSRTSEKVHLRKSVTQLKTRLTESMHVFKVLINDIVWKKSIAPKSNAIDTPALHSANNQLCSCSGQKKLV